MVCDAQVIAVSPKYRGQFCRHVPGVCPALSFLPLLQGDFFSWATDGDQLPSFQKSYIPGSSP